MGLNMVVPMMAAALVCGVKVTVDLQGGCSWENVTKCYVGYVVERDILLRDIP